MIKEYEMNRNSLEYLPVQIVATKLGQIYNPTGDPVQLALPQRTVQPATGDWKSGSWETVGTEYFARILVGPGGDVTLIPGEYDIYAKITDNPEVPVLHAGMLRIV